MLRRQGEEIMMIGKILAALALLTGATAAAETAAPSKAEVTAALDNLPYRSYPAPEIVAWQRDVREGLAHDSVDRVADRIAPTYGVAAPDMRRLVRNWLLTLAHQYDRDNGWKPAVRADLLALVSSVRRSSVGLTLVAESLDAIDDCSAPDFEALTAGSADAALDAYRIVRAAPCGGNFDRAVRAAGDRALPVLVLYAGWGSLPLRDTLPLYAWLTSPAALARVAAADRPALAAMLRQQYVEKLLAAGLNQRALSFLDALPADERATVLSPRFEKPASATVDGITLWFKQAQEPLRSHDVSMDGVADALEAAAADAALAPPKSSPAPQPGRMEHVVERSSAPILEVAEAMTVLGREPEARRLLATEPGLAEAKAAAACSYAGSEKCGRVMSLPMSALILDHLLNKPGEDPYPVAESVLAERSGQGIPASAVVRCRVFPAQDFPGLCDPAAAAPDLDQPTDDTAARAQSEAALAAAIPGFADLRAAMLSEVPRGGSTGDGRHRVTVPAPAAPFVEQAVPDKYRAPAKPVVPKGLSPLPPGFDAVRTERVGQCAVAISVSQTYDPTGEVSGGGYWVHLSDDAGAHWQRPLYTGLAENFPYVVLPSSSLPLINGDVLDLAVNVAEIDTATITYPPVALRTRRRAEGRYLTIPLADLRRDSDGDGLTDLAAHHLLLDRPRASGTMPFLVGSDAGAGCDQPPSRERLALVGLLGKLVDPSAAALVEPVDRPAGEIGLQWKRAAAATDRPLFILGRPQDYACLRTTRPIVIYGKEDIAALERMTPDFHAFELPPIVFNRARDRGFVRWSTGWAGGTYRLRFVDGRWVFDTIDSWIS
jgi:hypothetical protein